MSEASSGASWYEAVMRFSARPWPMCSACSGTGMHRPWSHTPCQACHGEGRMIRPASSTHPCQGEGARK